MNRWNEVAEPAFYAPDEKVFVFGSNLAGRHGKGAALWAHNNRGAIYGQGQGLQGRSYAIPTKDRNLVVLQLDIIKGYVRMFLEDVKLNPELEFFVTPIGCGLAGYSYDQVAPFFEDVPSNVELNQHFKEVLNAKVSNRQGT